MTTKVLANIRSLDLGSVNYPWAVLLSCSGLPARWVLVQEIGFLFIFLLNSGISCLIRIWSKTISDQRKGEVTLLIMWFCERLLFALPIHVIIQALPPSSCLAPLGSCGNSLMFSISPVSGLQFYINLVICGNFTTISLWFFFFITVSL